MRDRHAPLSHGSSFSILPRSDVAVLGLAGRASQRLPTGRTAVKNVALIACSRALRSAAP
jgi:hypothetical protein